MILNKVTNQGRSSLFAVLGDENASGTLLWPLDVPFAVAGHTPDEWKKLPDGPYEWDGTNPARRIEPPPEPK